MVWAPTDYVRFKEEAIGEIRAFLSQNCTMTPKQAMKILYQPLKIDDTDYDAMLVSKNLGEKEIARALGSIPRTLSCNSLARERNMPTLLDKVKTDVEMNMHGVVSIQGQTIGSNECNGGPKMLPTKTPNGGSTVEQSAWLVQWKSSESSR